MEAASNRQFGYTGLRVRDLDKAIEFFTNILGMKLAEIVDTPWNKGKFANLGYENDGKYGHSLELSWYAKDSPHYTEFVEGDQLDHLGIYAKDFDVLLKKLDEAGYPVKIGPTQMGQFKWAHVKAYEGIWLNVYCMAKD
jgi:catechol 2,3-dioxygenase-like lactoylglutathione lyase family enzyme